MSNNLNSRLAKLFGKPKPEADEPSRSPAILGEPTGGRGASKRPIFFVLAGMSCVALILGYSAIQRSNKNRAHAEEPAVETANSRGPAAAKELSVLVDRPITGTIGDDVRTATGEAFGPGAVPILSEAGPQEPSAAPPLAASAPGASQVAYAPAAGQYDDAWRAHNQRRDELLRARYERDMAAKEADSSVQLGRQAPAGAERPSSPGADLAAAYAAMARSQDPVAASSGRPSVMPVSDSSAQDRKRAFLASTATDDHYLAARREAPVSAMELKAGTVIPAVMVGGVNSDLPGQLVGQVTRNVYDSATGRYLLIPQGAKLVGTYDSGVSYGQERVLVAWNRIIFPDGSSLDLGAMPGADQGGYAGFNDRVNNHYARTFGSALMVSLFGAGVQLSQPQAANGENVSSGQTVAAALGQQVGQLGMEVARKNLNIQPTLEIRPGFRFNVQLTKDVVLRDWRAR